MAEAIECVDVYSICNCSIIGFQRFLTVLGVLDRKVNLESKSEFSPSQV